MGWGDDDKEDKEKSKPKDKGIKDVEDIDDDSIDGVCGKCEPHLATRTVRSPKDPPHSDWKIIEQWYEYGMPAQKVTGPPKNELSHAFVKRERTLYGKCRKQTCLVDYWVNDGPVFDCNQKEVQELQLKEGGKALSMWTNATRDDAYSKDSFQIKETTKLPLP
jgi:hypothetical protein